MTFTASSTTSTQSGFGVLAVNLPRQTRCQVVSLTRETGWSYCETETCAGAVSMGDIGLVVTEAELPDGSWRDLVSAFSERPAPPRVVVVTRLADESLWSDVLETGGFDLLPAPSDRKELGRVLELAATEFQAGRRAAAA